MDNTSQSLALIWAALVCLGVLSLAACVLLGWLLFRIHRATTTLLDWIEKIDQQVDGYLDKHALWTDVASQAVGLIPTTLEGLARLVLGSQELLRAIHHAGGLAKILNDKSKTP